MCGCASRSPDGKCTGAEPLIFAVGDTGFPAAEARACAFDVSCPARNAEWIYRQSASSPVNACTFDWNPPSFDEIGCAPNATNCDDWMACAYHGHCPSWCKARGYDPNLSDVWTCDGDKVVVCDSLAGGWGMQWEDCAAEGMHCAQAHKNASCTDGRPCPVASNRTCIGDHIIGCDVGTLLESNEDCGAKGEQCSDPSLGILAGSTCFSITQPACNPSTFVNRCDGTGARSQSGE
jgi:hypothetical protein